MKKRALKQAEQIREELVQVERVVAAVRRDWEEYVRQADEAYLKAVAYDLHGFYTGLERIFRSVADTIDDNVPEGEYWHRNLLLQIAGHIENVRPALLSEETAANLQEYMRFRHRIRNIYSFNLVPERIEGLVGRLPAVHEKVRANLEDFACFLEKLAGEEST